MRGLAASPPSIPGTAAPSRRLAAALSACVAIVGASLGGAGCAATLPPIEEVLPTLPSAWTQRASADGNSVGGAPPALAKLTCPSATARSCEFRDIDAGWVASFGDETLAALVIEGRTANPDLQVTRARLFASLAQARVRAASLFPELGVSGSGFKQRVSLNQPRQFGAVSGGTGAGGSSEVRYDANYQLSWEIDLFGRARQERWAGIADAEAARQDLNDAHLSLEGRIASAWFELVAARTQLEIDRESLDSFERAARAVERRYQRGLRNALDSRLAKSDEASARAALVATERRVRDASRALEVLLGRFPAAELAAERELPAIPPPVPAGLPAELLVRRPDLRAAASRLDAAGHDAKAAFANLFPRIRLTFAGGVTSTTLREIVDPETVAWRLAGELTQPIFQGGRLRFEYERAKSQAEARLFELAQSALDAFREVEDALDAEQALRLRVVQLETASEHAGRAAVISRDQYGRGLIDITTLLVAQRRALDTRTALLEARRAVLDNRVRLHLALGGDFGTRALAELAEEHG